MEQDEGWISERIIPVALEIGEITVGYTKKAIEQISKRLESNDRNVDNMDNSEIVDESEYCDNVYVEDSKIYEITDDEEEKKKWRLTRMNQLKWK